MPAFCVGVEICEDLWVPAPESARLAAAGATVIANLSASDESIGKADYRRQLVAGQSARLICGYVYADAGEGESSGDLVFSGHDLLADEGHRLLDLLVGDPASLGAPWLLAAELDEHVSPT